MKRYLLMIVTAYVIIGGLFLSYLWVTGAMAATYYIAANGFDSNSGTSKTSPWLHAPGMIGCTANCALIDNGSGNPGHAQPGDQFILRGGDVWHSGNLPWTWRSAGTSGNRIYIGVDKTWYSGDFWTRPVLNLDGTEPSVLGAAFRFGGGEQAAYSTLDNIEFTGLYFCMEEGSGYSGYVGLYGSAATSLTNNYFHGWSHCYIMGSTDGCELVTGYQNGQTISYNVFDGSDTSGGGDSCYAVYMSGGDKTTTLSYNYVQYVGNGFVGAFPIVHDNVILHIIRDFSRTTHGSYHGNAFENNWCDSPCYIYNNVFGHVHPDAGVTFWDAPGAVGDPPGEKVDYYFNNVVLNTTDGNVFNIVPPGGGIMFNNTVECGQDSGPPGGLCTGNSGSTFRNNHFITSFTSPLSSYSVQSNNVTQTKSVANSEGYTLSNSFAPTLSSNSTIGVGLNQTSVCGGLTNAAAAAACLLSTTYACTYQTSDHTVVCPAITPVARPTSAAWDIGAYQYTDSSILYGDVSENGSVTAYDASLASQYAVGLITLTSTQITKADVSGNGSVSAYDASLIAQYAVGLIIKFPVEG